MPLLPLARPSEMAQAMNRIVHAGLIITICMVAAWDWAGTIILILAVLP